MGWNTGGSIIIPGANAGGGSINSENGIDEPYPNAGGNDGGGATPTAPRNTQIRQRSTPKLVAMVDPQVLHVGDGLMSDSRRECGSSSGTVSRVIASRFKSRTLTACGFPLSANSMSNNTRTGSAGVKGALSLSFVVTLWPIQKQGAPPTMCFECKKMSLPTESPSMKPQPLSALNIRMTPVTPCCLR